MASVAIRLDIKPPPSFPKKQARQWENDLAKLLVNPGTWGSIAIVQGEDAIREAKNLLQQIRYRMKTQYQHHVHVRTRLIPIENGVEVFVALETQLQFDFDTEEENEHES